MAKYRLTANKTKFYNLAKKFWPDIEPMRRVEFIKYHRVRDYGLIFGREITFTGCSCPAHTGM